MRMHTKTKTGLSYGIYARQLRSSKKRNHAEPTYSIEEFREWLYSQELFHRLYDNWKRLDYQKEYTPSIDRKTPSLSYTMSNIKLMTWNENNKKGYIDRKNGLDGKSKAIV